MSIVTAVAESKLKNPPHRAGDIAYIVDLVREKMGKYVTERVEADIQGETQGEVL
jgi:hypothetical protein